MADATAKGQKRTSAKSEPTPAKVQNRRRFVGVAAAYPPIITLRA